MSSTEFDVIKRMKIIFYITPHENTRTGASVLKLHELEYDGSKKYTFYTSTSYRLEQQNIHTIRRH